MVMVHRSDRPLVAPGRRGRSPILDIGSPLGTRNWGAGSLAAHSRTTRFHARFISEPQAKNPIDKGVLDDLAQTELRPKIRQAYGLTP